MKEIKVKPTIRQSSDQKAFTIIELLTVMSVIMLLMGIILPALNKVKQHARNVKQKAQFHSIGVAMDLFNAEMEGYPPSNFDDGTCVLLVSKSQPLEHVLNQEGLSARRQPRGIGR